MAFKALPVLPLPRLPHEWPCPRRCGKFLSESRSLVRHECDGHRTAPASSQALLLGTCPLELVVWPSGTCWPVALTAGTSRRGRTDTARLSGGAGGEDLPHAGSWRGSWGDGHGALEGPLQPCLLHGAAEAQSLQACRAGQAGTRRVAPHPAPPSLPNAEASLRVSSASSASGASSARCHPSRQLRAARLASVSQCRVGITP